MLVAGLVLSGVFLLTAIFAPLLAPVRVQPAARPVRRVRCPAAAVVGAPARHDGRRLRRPLPGDLGLADGAVRHRHRRRRCRSFVGVLLGLVSGYFGGWLDRVLVVICDAIYAFPSLLLAIVMAIVISGGQSSLWGGILAAAISITVIYVPQYFRVVRAEVGADQGRGVRRVGQGDRRRPLADHDPARLPQRHPHAAADRHPERLRGDLHPRRRWASSASASSRRRPPSGATTSASRCRTSPVASGGRRCCPASPSRWSCSA